MDRYGNETILQVSNSSQCCEMIGNFDVIEESEECSNLEQLLLKEIRSEENETHLRVINPGLVFQRLFDRLDYSIEYVSWDQEGISSYKVNKTQTLKGWMNTAIEKRPNESTSWIGLRIEFKKKDTENRFSLFLIVSNTSNGCYAHDARVLRNGETQLQEWI